MRLGSAALGRPRPAVLGRLGAFGAVVGTGCDALHNQVILEYNALPVSVDLGVGVVRTSAIVPPLLAIAYALLGGVLPLVAKRLSTAGLSCSLQIEKLPNACLAVMSTATIIRLSEMLVGQHVDPLSATALLLALAVLQWLVLDGTYASLLLAVVAAIGGPLAELPFISLGFWSYLDPNYFPLHSLGAGDSLGLDLITGPCYFAVTTDAIAWGNYFCEAVPGGRREPPPASRPPSK